MSSFLDFFFPQSCIICHRLGGYVCVRCKKYFKRNLPECYVCRRLSSGYITHEQCKKNTSLAMVYVAWEYNTQTRDLIRQFKYKNVYDMREGIYEFFLDTLIHSSICSTLRDTTLVPIPISNLRYSERGFNQVDYLARRLSIYFKIPILLNLLGSKNTKLHQARKDKSHREYLENPFFVREKTLPAITTTSITLVDDVITTGATLEKASESIKKLYGEQIVVNAICLFRGKPKY